MNVLENIETITTDGGGYDPVVVGEALEVLHEHVPTAAAAAAAALAAEFESDDPTADFLLSASPFDDGNAECVKFLYGDELIFCEAYGWMRYTGTHYTTDGARAHLRDAIRDTLQRRRVLAVDAEKEAIVTGAKPSTRHIRDCEYQFEAMVTVSVSEFDRSPDHLNCLNGVVDLRTGALIPHNSGQRFTYCCAVDYDPDADQSKWLAFLDGAIGGGRQVNDYLQCATGYSLTGHTSEEIVLYPFGPTRAGKGVFTETMQAAIPKPIAVEVDFNTFTRERANDSNNFDLAPLKAARLVFASESNRYQKLNAAKIKVLTGGNDIYCAFKHRDHFSYRPQFAVWLVSNHPARADVDDDAAWYRLRVIEFPNSFAGRENKSLKAELRKPENLRGVLAWAVQGAIDWYAMPNGLETPDAVILSTQEQRDLFDFVTQWMDECCVNEADAWTANEMLYSSYANWCAGNGVEPKRRGSLSQNLTRKGYDVGVRKQWQSKLARGVKGFRLTGAEVERIEHEKQS